MDHFFSKKSPFPYVVATGGTGSEWRKNAVRNGCLLVFVQGRGSLTASDEL